MDLSDQPRLFRLAPEALTVAAHWRSGEGWHLVISVKRGDETWSEARQEVYSALTTPELVDVLVADLAVALGL